MSNKVTVAICCHCEAVASIMRATVFSVVNYTHASPSGYQRTDRAAGAHIDESVDTSSAEPHIWPQGTSATPSRCPIRHTSQQLYAGAGGAGDVEVVAVAAAGATGDAVAAGWSSASSSSLMDASWVGCRASVCAPTL